MVKTPSYSKASSQYTVALNLITYITLRWFNECKVNIASERLMRKRAAEVVGDCVVVEKVALTFPVKDGGGEEVRLRPFGYIPDLWSRIVQLLEQNERYSNHIILMEL